VIAQTDSNNVSHLFEIFQNGISANNVSDFSDHFSKKIYISLSDGTTGYFSSNQAYYILKKYLSVYEPIKCELERQKLFDRSAYATGKLKYTLNGRRGRAGVYISVQTSGKRWFISQITIN
jgi:hypothetical protein